MAKPVICATCGVEFLPPLNGRYKYCPGRCRERARKNTILRHEYGISLEEYEKMRADQGDRCAICNRTHEETKMKRFFHIDHDHKTGVVRGLLCITCNLLMARVDADPSVIHRLKEYCLLGEKGNKIGHI